MCKCAGHSPAFLMGTEELQGHFYYPRIYAISAFTARIKLGVYLLTFPEKNAFVVETIFKDKLCLYVCNF